MDIHFQGWPAGGDLHFARPAAVFEAWTAEAVGPALAAAEAARRKGAWLAGFACYELGLAFEPKLAVWETTLDIVIDFLITVDIVVSLAEFSIVSSILSIMSFVALSGEFS